MPDGACVLFRMCVYIILFWTDSFFFCFNNIKTSFCYCRCVSTSGAAALHVLHQVNRSTRGSHSSGQCVSIVFGYRLTKLYGKSRARGWHTWYFPNRHAHVAPISPVQLSWTFFRCFGKLFIPLHSCLLGCAAYQRFLFHFQCVWANGILVL